MDPTRLAAARIPVSGFPADLCVRVLQLLAAHLSPRTLLRLTSTCQALEDVKAAGEIWSVYCARITGFFDADDLVTAFVARYMHMRAYKEYTRLWACKTQGLSAYGIQQAEEDDFHRFPQAVQRRLELLSRQTLVRTTISPDPEPLDPGTPIFLVYSAAAGRLDVRTGSRGDRRNTVYSYSRAEARIFQNPVWCLGSTDYTSTGPGCQDLQLGAFYADHGLAGAFDRLLGFLDHPFSGWSGQMAGAPGRRSFTGFPVTVPHTQELLAAWCMYALRNFPDDTWLSDHGQAYVLYRAVRGNPGFLDQMSATGTVRGIQIRNFSFYLVYTEGCGIGDLLISFVA